MCADACACVYLHLCSDSCACACFGPGGIVICLILYYSLLPVPHFNNDSPGEEGSITQFRTTRKVMVQDAIK